ncbi:hypothetical protein Hanom_Chr14g01299191 [Helianthus anomalus]
MSNAWYYQSMQEFEVVCKPQLQTGNFFIHLVMIDFGIRVWGLKMNWG